MTDYIPQSNSTPVQQEVPGAPRDLKPNGAGQPLTHDKAMAAEFLTGLDPTTVMFQFERGLRSQIGQIPFEKAWRIVEKVNTPTCGFNVFVVSRHLIVAAANSNEQCGTDSFTGLLRARLPGTLVLPRSVKPNGAADSASDIDIRPVSVTFFPNKSAQSQHCSDLTLPQLAARIRLETGPSKLTLPWLKLAVFGDKPSDKNCLRTNAN
jgi:hypothetical protein